MLPASPRAARLTFDRWTRSRPGRSTRWAASGRREARDGLLGPDLRQRRAEHPVVGELLAGAQGRVDLVLRVLEVFLGHAVLHRLLQDRRRARAVAELRLLAPQQLIGQPAGERLAQELLLELAGRRALGPGGKPQAEAEGLRGEERAGGLEPRGPWQPVAA